MARLGVRLGVHADEGGGRPNRVEGSPGRQAPPPGRTPSETARFLARHRAVAGARCRSRSHDASPASVPWGQGVMQVTIWAVRKGQAAGSNARRHAGGLRSSVTARFSLGLSSWLPVRQEAARPLPALLAHEAGRPLAVLATAPRQMMLPRTMATSTRSSTSRSLTARPGLPARGRARPAPWAPGAAAAARGLATRDRAVAPLPSARGVLAADAPPAPPPPAARPALGTEVRET